ncbi:MAG TPA: SDR family NAD(P)-dependent oxidoreductase [Acidimicrobiales bacterium]|jgi:3-oxoacyl-[acyl-carrier protein] reductase|nr:SDR family NAD(P)-dependent oxidoreductase [Acidimicrobiales bacterium]
MDLGLDGKRALVTGSTSGLGRAIAQRLASEGVTVIVHGRDAARAEEVAGSIASTGGRAELVLGDLADEGAPADVAAAALAGGPVDILVNNAGEYAHRSWKDATADDWLRSYRINVLSAVLLIQQLVPPMRARGWGRVIQIGGGLAQQPSAAYPHYGAALAARHNLAVSLARELQDTGVTSNVVAPGAILVPALVEIMTQANASFEWGETWAEIERGAVRDLAPNDVGRFGTPEEVAAAVAFLASALSGYVSGSVLRVDGGLLRSVP